MFKDALFASSSKRTRSRSPRPSMSRRSTTPPPQDDHQRPQSGILSRRWSSSTRPNSSPGEASHSTALRRRDDQPARAQGISPASSNSLPAASHPVSSLPSEAKQTETRTPRDRANLRDEAYVQGPSPLARSIQVPLGHRWQQWLRALLKMEVNQQAKAAGVHGREATSTFGVGTCGDNLCAHTHAPQGIMASGDACGSAFTRGDSTGIDDMAGVPPYELK